MKRHFVLPLLTALLVLAFSAAPAFAAKKAETPKADEGGALLDDPTLTPELEAELQELTLQKEAALGIGENSSAAARAGKVGTTALNSYGLQTRPVTNYKQETSYYCGPASARQSLSFHKTHSGSSTSLPSQSTLANKIGTTTSGSTTTGIVKALNSYDGTFGKVWYLASDITDTSNPYETFVNRIGTMLRSITVNPNAPITLMKTDYIPRYNGHSSRHYMTISGIDDRTSPMKMRSVDPNNNSSYYGVYWDKVGSTTSNGLCRACYQADLGGTNKVMAW